MIRRAAAVVGGGLALAAAGAPSAPAATVTMAGDECLSPRGGCPFPPHTLEVRDSGGESNDVRVVRDGSAYVVTDARTPLTAGRGCESQAPDRVRCAAPFGPARLVVDAGPGDDAVDAALPDDGPLTTTSIAAGPGADLVRGSAGTDTIRGGGGRDVLEGREGVDFLRDDDRTGVDVDADTLDGGPGVDSVSYADRTAGVTADLVAGGPAGEFGEGDTLRALEHLAGGAGGDVLRVPEGGSVDVTSVYGGLGPDHVVGGGRVAGGPGDDLVEGGSGADRLEGGGGRDRLLGMGGDDVLVDSDTLPQFPFSPPPADADALDGGPGRDAVSYAGRTTAVLVDLVQGTGGGAGEGDVLTTVEDAIGGQAGDTLAGDGGDNRLVADASLGIGSAADLFALDRLTGRDGDDRLEGGPGPDAYDAGGGDDTVVPGNAGDRRIEPVACGGGSDLVHLPDPRDLVAGCEQAELDQPPAQGRPGTARIRFPTRILSAGRARLAIRCRPCRTPLEATFLTERRAPLRRRSVRLRDRRTLVIEAPRRARLLRLRYDSPRVGIETGLIVRIRPTR
jgi:RTX calcium-binding nonapeptide repeat (4 copies)